MSSRPGRLAEIENNFIYHAPTHDQEAAYASLRVCGMNIAKTILDLTPVSREQSLAITKIEEAIMWANAAIARNT